MSVEWISWWCKCFSSLSSLKWDCLTDLARPTRGEWIHGSVEHKVQKLNNNGISKRTTDLTCSQPKLKRIAIEAYCNCYILLSVNLYLLSANLYCAFSTFCITLLNQKSCVTSSIFKEVNLISNITPSRHRISRTVWSESTRLWKGDLAAIHGTLNVFFPKFFQEHLKNPLKTNQTGLSCDCPSFFVPNAQSFLFTVSSINQLHSNFFYLFIPKLDPSLHLLVDRYLLSVIKTINKLRKLTESKIYFNVTLSGLNAD